MDASVAQGYLPFVVNLLKGNAVDAYDETPVTSSFTVLAGGFSGKTGSASGSSDERYIAIHPVKGVITKESQVCGPRGTIELMRDMKRMDNDPSVVAHVLEMDSGGGEGTNCMTVGNYLRTEIQKPIIAWYNGLNCSASYWISSSADEIYAAETTDIVGSIGVFVSIIDVRGYLEKEGLTLHEIYADQSTGKNKDFKTAMEGEYDDIKKNFLNPYAQSFIDAVKSLRDINDDGDVFTGKTYMSEEAIQVGLIDGIKTFDEVIARAAELADETEYNNSNKRIDMETPKLNAVLNVDNLESDKDGYVSMSTDDVLRIEAALANVPEETPDNGFGEELVANMNQRIDSLESSMKTFMDSFDEKVKAAMDVAPGATEQKPKTQKGDEKWDDPDFVAH